MRLSDDDEEEDVKPSTSAKQPEKSSSWVHRNLQKIHKVHGSKAAKYDPHERNPMFAGAEMSNLWELSTLADHYHPSAALFGKTLLEDQQVHQNIASRKLVLFSFLYPIQAVLY